MDGFSVEWLLSQSSFVNYCLRDNEGDIAYWENYLAQHPDAALVIREAEEVVKTSGWLLVAQHTQPAAMERLDAWLLDQERPRVRWYRPVAAAATILILVAVFVLFKREASTPEMESVVVKQQQQQLLWSTRGQARKAIILPDSSFVLLESNSELRLEAGFSLTSRELQLEGTAYFRVAKNVVLPFVVSANKYVVTALGTAFRVTSAGGALQVFLEEGRVKVEKNNGANRTLIALLAPTEKLVLGLGKRKPVKSTYPATELNSWKASEIIFDRTPVEEVIQQLEVCYNVRIHVEELDIKKETFSGRFKGDNLASVLDMLCFSLNKQYNFSSDSTSVLIK